MMDRRCPICESEKLNKIVIETQEAQGSKEMLLWRCQSCKLIFAHDYQKDRSDIYNDKYAAWNQTTQQEEERQIALSKKTAFRKQLQNLSRYMDIKNKRVLDIGTGNGYLLEVLKEMDADCYGTDISKYSVQIAGEKFPGKVQCGRLETLDMNDQKFDIVFLTDVLEHFSAPKRVLHAVNRLLKPDGLMFIISPNTDSLSRKLLGRKWFQYKYEHVMYFNRASLEKLLEKTQFKLLEFKKNKKKFTISYYYYYFQKYSFLGIEKIIKKLYPYFPNAIKAVSFNNPITGEFLAIAQKHDQTNPKNT